MKSTVFLLFLGVVVAGCAATHDHPSAAFSQDEIEPVLNAVQELHGPPRDRWDLTDLVSSSFVHDFNGDGHEELVLLFADGDLGKLRVKSVDELKGVVTTGFIMLAQIDGRLWPVFYHFDEYRVQLSYKTVLGVTGLVNEGGRDGMQAVWGWQKRCAEWPARWTALSRAWDPDGKAWGSSRITSRYVSIYGK